MTGDAEERQSKPIRFTLRQIHLESARIYELPAGAVAVVLAAKLEVLKSGVMFIDSAMYEPWEGWELRLDGPQENENFHELMQRFPWDEATLLNEQMVGRSVPLRPCQLDGIIMGFGWSSVPPTFHDEQSESIAVWLKDEQGTEFRFEFEARVDRSIIRKYEQRLAQRRAERPATRVPLFDFGRATPGLGVTRPHSHETPAGDEPMDQVYRKPI